MKTTDYEKQANDFLSKTKTVISIEFLKYDYHFHGDTDKRDIYRVAVKRNNRQFNFNFGNSLHCSGEYIGHKNMCLNNFGKYLFSENEYKNLKYQTKTFEIIKNKNFKIPTNYDILACLQKYDVGTLEEFCSEFGYDAESKKAEKLYKDVCKEYDNVCKIWTDEEIEALQEIQ